MPSQAAQALAEKVHVLARDECRAIGRALAAKHRVHNAVHDARKAIRRLRSLLGLVEGRIEAATPVDIQFEKLGDGLSLLRDSHVVIETARKVAGNHRKRWKPAIETMAARRDERLARMLASDPGFLKRRALVRRLEARLEFLPWSQLRLSDVQSALEASQQRAHRAERQAASDPTADNIHRWRRRVRRLRLQLDAVAKVSPASVQKHSRKHPGHDPKALHRLGDNLGARRDEHMLESALKRMRGLPHRPQMLAQLDAARPAAPKPLASKEYPEPLLAPPQAEKDIVG